MATKILLTGATGFVGKVLVKKLAKNFGSQNLYCLTYNKESEFEHKGRKILEKLNIPYKLVDLTQSVTLKSIAFKPNLVIHLAAETDTSKKDHYVNSIGTKNLYRALGKLNPSIYFIHIGTMVEVVGRPNCTTPIDESSKDYPTNEYTRTKLEGENFLVEKCLRKKFRLTVIRPNTVYGKGVRKNSLFDMVRDMVKENSVITRINWPGKSALIHVEDLTNLIIKFVNLPGKPGKPEKYLAYNENLSIFEISKIIHKKLGKKFKPIILPGIFWNTIKSIRLTIPLFEKAFPSFVYNYLWRFGIIIDNVVWCKSDKIFEKFKIFRPKKFSTYVKDVV